LHLGRLELAAPSGASPIVISSPLPGAFIAVLKRLSFRSVPSGGASKDEEL
jgi:hypothetical protein